MRTNKDKNRCDEPKELFSSGKKYFFRKKEIGPRSYLCIDVGLHVDSKSHR